MFHVSKSYAAGSFALRDVSLEFRKGEFVFLTGPSGAGKTTLLKLLFSAERPSEGQIVVLGRNIARLGQGAIPQLRRSIGVVFQLVNEPEILLADEPTGNLDPDLTLDIMDLIASAATRGTTVVVATHELALVSRYGKRAVRLDGGGIVEDSLHPGPTA
jgi:ABC-type ATPase involved in cell division